MELVQIYDFYTNHQATEKTVREFQLFYFVEKIAINSKKKWLKLAYYH